MLQEGIVSDSTPACIEGADSWQTIETLGLWREGIEVESLTWEEISYLAERGYIDGSTPLCQEGDSQWTTLEALATPSSEAVPPLETPPPEPAPAPVSGHPPIRPGHPALTHLLGKLFAARLIISTALVLLCLGILWFFKAQISEIFIPSAAVRPATPSEAKSEPPTPVALAAVPSESIASTSEPTASSDPSTPPSEPLSAEAKPEPSPSTEPPSLTAQAEITLESQSAPSAQDSAPAEPLASASLTPAPSTPPSEPAAITAATPPPVVAPTPALQTTKSPSVPPVPHLKPFEMPQLTAQELDELLIERFASMPIKLPDNYDERPAKDLKIHEGSFTLETKLKNNPKVEVIYRVPLHNKHRPGPDADNIVLVGLHANALRPRKANMIDGEMVAEKSRLHGQLTPFADRLGYTAFAIHVFSTSEMASDKEEYFAYGGPEWVDVVFRAKAEIEKLHKLKERKLLVYGGSEGAQFVQNIAVAAPERVAAVMAHSGPKITPPEQSSDTAWFLSITRGDAMQKEYEAVYNRLLEQGGNVVFNIFPPNYIKRGLSNNFYHSTSKIASLAGRSFLRGVVDSMDVNGGTDRTRWPFVRDRTKPLRIFPRTSLQARNIPREFIEYLPSRAFAQCLQAVPAPMHLLTLPAANMRSTKAFVGIPPLGKAKGVIVYAHPYSFLDLQLMFDNIYYLAGMGYVVIAPQIKKSDPADIEAALRYISQSAGIKDLPLVVMGYGKTGNLAWDIVAKNREITPRAVAMLEFTPQDSFDESKLPPGCRMNAPVVFVYDEKPLTQVETSQEAEASRQIVTAVKDFSNKCRERSQLAKVVILPRPEPIKTTKPLEPAVVQKLEETRIAQLSLEAAEDFITKVIERNTAKISR